MFPIQNPMKQGVILKVAGLNARGVCLEACRRWVKAALAEKLIPGETVYAIINEEGIHDLLHEHRKRNTKSETKIKGLDLQITSKTAEGPLTHLDVIHHVLNAPGVYICIVDTEKGDGHAFAFSTINPRLLLFFDPNFAEWQFDDGKAMSIWWDKFWKGDLATFSHTRSYDKTYPGANHELWQYSISADSKKRAVKAEPVK